MNRTLNVLRTLVGLVFLLASFDKLQHPGEFAEIINNYKILPELLINPVAVILPWLEFLCGLGLIFNVMARGASLIVCVLMAVFLSALGFNYFRGLDVACGCFTTDPTAQAGSIWYLLRDGSIGLACLAVFWMQLLQQRNAR